MCAQKMKVRVAITSATTAVCARCTVRIPHASVLQNARTTSNRSVFLRIFDKLRWITGQIQDHRKKNVAWWSTDKFFFFFFSLLWPPYGIRQAIIFCPVVSSIFFLLLSFFPRLISAVAEWMYTILPHMVLL